MDQIQIGKFIAQCRKEKGLTQQELADKIGCSDKTISKWENGRGLPDYSYFGNLCRTLDITTDELLRGSKTKNKSNDILGEYLAYKAQMDKKQEKVKMVIICLFVLVLFLLGYFINSYKKINIYSLEGQSENFTIKRGMFVKSNINTILDIGDLRSDTVDYSNIKSIIIAVKEKDDYKLIEGHSGDSFSDIELYNNIRILSESYGYDEELDKIDNKNGVSNLYLFILYNKDKELFLEKMNIKMEKILSNDKFVNKKSDGVMSEGSSPVIDLETYKNSEAYYNRLIKEGFTEELNNDGICNGGLLKKLGDNEYLKINYFDKSFSYHRDLGDLQISNNVLLSNGIHKNVDIRFDRNDEIYKILSYRNNSLMGEERTDDEEEQALRVAELYKKYILEL